MKRASSSAFSLAASCWLLLALVATPCSGARAALDRPGRGGAEGGQPEPLRLEDGLLLVHEQADSNNTNSGRHKVKSGAPPEVIKTKRSSSSKKSRSTASDAYTPRRNVAPAGHDHSDDHPRPLHRHNDLFVPALERRGGGGSSGRRDRQKTSPPQPVAVTTDDLHGGLHHNQPERERTSRNLRGSSGNPRERSD